MALVPPIKSQGIKTKLSGWIFDNVKDTKYSRWVEPFMGTGAVAFNILPKKALLCDSNPHLITFYKAIQSRKITGSSVQSFLHREGSKLLDSEGKYYYEVRERFNRTHDPLDFLLLNRSCFNGMIRFNRKGGFNVPFCKKPNRFAQSLITKIKNQVEHVSKIISTGNYEFINQDFKDTLKNVNSGDLIYADPPYLGRYVDYFDSWSEKDEIVLRELLKKSDAKFILSTWLKNKYRTNETIFSLWKDCYVAAREHFYHVGGKEKNRNPVYEALLSNWKTKDSFSNHSIKEQIMCFEAQEQKNKENSKGSKVIPVFLP